MYAWEYTFMKKVKEIREKEIGFLKQNATLMAISTAIANHSPFMVRSNNILSGKVTRAILESLILFLFLL